MEKAQPFNLYHVILNHHHPYPSYHLLRNHFLYLEKRLLTEHDVMIFLLNFYHPNHLQRFRKFYLHVYQHINASFKEQLEHFLLLLIHDQKWLGFDQDLVKYVKLLARDVTFLEEQISQLQFQIFSYCHHGILLLLLHYAQQVRRRHLLELKLFIKLKALMLRSLYQNLNWARIQQTCFARSNSSFWVVLLIISYLHYLVIRLLQALSSPVLPYIYHGAYA